MVSLIRGSLLIFYPFPFNSYRFFVPGEVIMRTYKRRSEEPTDPYRAQPLPVAKPVAGLLPSILGSADWEYLTTLQTVDMVEHLVKLDWPPESVIMIDTDAGVSGMKSIEERPGMSAVMRLIESQQIGAVAAQDVDRFFRDVTQIQTNLFIDACRRNNGLVLTPNMVFDFTRRVVCDQPPLARALSHANVP